jgi:transcriptional regulator with AAA-type ATPase domain
LGFFKPRPAGFDDEVGELPLSVQPKLLRSLQEGAIRRVGANVEKSVDNPQSYALQHSRRAACS